MTVCVNTATILIGTRENLTTFPLNPCYPTGSWDRNYVFLLPSTSALILCLRNSILKSLVRVRARLPLWKLKTLDTCSSALAPLAPCSQDSGTWPWYAYLRQELETRLWQCQIISGGNEHLQECGGKVGGAVTAASPSTNPSSAGSGKT